MTLDNKPADLVAAAAEAATATAVAAKTIPSDLAATTTPTTTKPALHLTPAQIASTHAFFRDNFGFAAATHARLTIHPDATATIDLLRTDLPLHYGGRSGESVMNGCVIAGLYDMIVGSLAHSLGAHPEGIDDGVRNNAATMNVSVNFMRPCPLELPVVMSARVDSVARRAGIVYVSAEMKDAQGRTCSVCTGIAKYAPRPQVKA
ncbi:hypothetical protein AMAG_15534 [Allomyces macrogynus ATCC 38327]|uniref:Thioesterase domain-containing protein n=1 Tax=Allomyces macrogynus (strain ATCC 38327) TaxID=578462 RepID=A0A0L0T904_ALLM3|nr:hypothetical protein AMAG_15534 [Allomyces macrogynus ATCC 38327]|eukprot:KNE71293.1 hypothetical protein AMAG_15534 [Allomyces macrogynus ATCC 38327]